MLKVLMVELDIESNVICLEDYYKEDREYIHLMELNNSTQ